jgi:hypothetical protein
MSDLLNKIKASKAELDILKAELKQKVYDSFHSICKELFIAYPELNSFGWEQFTPYFNDGDPCEFSSNHDYPNINGHDENYSRNEQPEGVIDIVTLGGETIYDNNMRKHIPNKDYNPYYGEIVSTVKTFLEQFDDNDMYDLFGNDASVLITIDGISVSNFENHN